MEDCIFCEIIDRQIPADIVYEDSDVIAFNDINPVAPVHVLIVPKTHIGSAAEISDTRQHADMLLNIHTAANKVATKLGISDTGYRLITNCGKDSGQMVMHLHYHLIGGVKLGEKIV